jgi:hypothetical protein
MGSPGFALTLGNSGGDTYSGTTTIESGATLKGGATKPSARRARRLCSAGELWTSAASIRP